MRLAAALAVALLAVSCGSGDDKPADQPSEGGGLTAATATAASPESDGSLGDATTAKTGGDDEVIAGAVPITPESTEAAAGEQPLPHCENDSMAIDAGTRASAEAATVCVLNKVRRRNGRRSLKQNSQLYSSAQAHATDMVQKQYFSHTSASGRSSTARIKSTGYLSGVSTWQVGENIAWGSGAFSTPRAIVQSWMNSAGHRRNIMERSYREAGLAIVVGAPEQVGLSAGTYAHNFGQRSS
jgi:uncharacterized protein YkwD